MINLLAVYDIDFPLVLHLIDMREGNINPNGDVIFSSQKDSLINLSVRLLNNEYKLCS